ncbi:hypothetical protein AB840_11345 [Megasphaera cerevisiae DSM 20462]|uniref:YopX protein domain-containing protein n=1 Tax=Megasphaera cerevisiae DSM 20462 TaxID=1122219 RepID=A0A0J6WTJ8_9FIRM|nr:YopX family protein [Megasphaera cerevisiae]KMO85854.1 hypothetical protein AB840_11345 [Megasphaera cerevisiae DSM 20462]SJZ59115.1 phage uncharacterized protein TIGR01671 [Megasphaera cerevisiae DSM 20462]
MRDIKFRAWDRNKKMMEKVVCIEMLSPYVYTNVIVEFKEHGRVINDNHLIGGTDGCDTAILMQYTGLKDSHGKEIYEGDILGVTIINRRDGSKRKPYNLIVVYKNGSFVYQYIQGGWKESNIYNHIDNWADDVTFEIIGNRYENPDLLKERENG